MVFVGTEKLYCLDVSERYRPRLASWSVHGMVPADVRVSGSTLYLTEKRSVDQEYETYDVRMCEYYLHRIDLSDPYRLDMGAAVNIPGTPVGISTDGSAIYTKAYWSFEEDGKKWSLNVVSLTGNTATIEAAYELANYNNLWVINDKAYIRRQEYNRIYDEVARRYHRYYNTTIEVIDLVRPDAPFPASMIKLTDYYATVRVVDDHIFVHSYSHPGIWVYDVAEDCEILPPQFYMVNGNINSIKVLEDRAVLLQGLYGATALDLA